MDNNNPTNPTTTPEPASASTTVTTVSTDEPQSPQIDYSKIDGMINKGMAHKENAILKSYFEQMGMSGDEMTEAINAFKSAKKEQSEKEKNAFKEMQKENKELKNQILQNNLNASALKVATKIGANTDNISDIMKLADMSKCLDDKGEVQEAEIETAFKAVLERIPSFKKETTNQGGFHFGNTSGNSNNNNNASSDELKRLFGIKTSK